MAHCYTYVLELSLVDPRCNTQRRKVEFDMTVLDLKIINKETNKEGCYIFFYE